jgi:hypothetical protein
MAFRQEATLLLYRNQYESFGSFELGKLKWDFDIGCYFNLWVSPYLRDEHLDLRWLRRQLRMAPLILAALGNFNALFRRVAESLRKRGEFYRANQGRFTPGLDHLDFLQQVGLARAARCSRRPGHLQRRAGARCTCWGPTRRSIRRRRCR